MKDKEKQIEEMAKDCYYVAHLLRFNDPYMLSLKGWSKLTKEMIKLGWIKPNEDCVVLTKEEYGSKLQDAYDNGLKWGTKWGRKETAANYKVAMMLSIQEMQKYLEIDDEQAKLLYHHNYEIAKQFDVETKE